MAKGKRAKLRKKQQGMEVEGGSGGGGAATEWQTGPMDDGFIAMDTTDVGAAAGGAAKQQQSPAAPKAPAPKRGQTSRKQKEKKRKSLERALAVASRKETKVTQKAGAQEKKKGLKKLWQNEKKGE